LRYDILTPRGPVDRHLSPLGEAQLAPALSWLLGGIPEMQPDLPQHISAPLALNLTGPAARQVVISINRGAISVVPQAETDLAAIAAMTSSTSDFLAYRQRGYRGRRFVDRRRQRCGAAFPNGPQPHLNDINRNDSRARVDDLGYLWT
jgi:hypothetical protein